MRKKFVLLTVATLLSTPGLPLELRAQTVVTYQGRMLAHGTNFNGTGQFKFALVTSTNLNKTATAKANISGGFVTTYDVIFGGSGYTSAPAVTVLGGGGSGATARASVAGGIVTSIVAENPGAGYTSAPIVVIAAPPPNISYTTYWSNDDTSNAGSEPTAAVSANVSNGLFTVPLGDSTIPGMAPLNPSLFTRPELQLRIWFSDGASGFVALDPAQNLTHAPYAAVAQIAAGVAGGLQVQSNTNGAPNLVGGSSANFVAPGVYGATIAGGGAEYYPGSVASNEVTAVFGTVGGGLGNAVRGDFGTVSGGYLNSARGTYATVSGGSVNLASGLLATVAGGGGNSAIGGWATISGGGQNTNSGTAGTIGGGRDNLIGTSSSATIGGGLENQIGNFAEYATIPGGYRNQIGDNAMYSFAAGQNARALHRGSFVWCDFAGGVPFSSTANNQFAVRTIGGLRFVGDVQIGDGSGDYRRLQLGGGNSSGFLYGSYPNLGDGIHMGYNWYADANGAGRVFNTGGATSRISARYGEVVLAVGGINAAPNTVRLTATSTGVAVYGTFNNLSDRNAKQDFSPVNPAQILESVVSLPVSQWSYKEDPVTRHIGPVAQDFHARFKVGTDDRHIAPMDQGGVALAAIQGLNQKLEDQSREKDARIKALEQEIAELKQALKRLPTSR